MTMLWGWGGGMGRVGRMRDWEVRLDWTDLVRPRVTGDGLKL